jgi:hypothetical protein
LNFTAAGEVAAMLTAALLAAATAALADSPPQFSPRIEAQATLLGS